MTVISRHSQHYISHRLLSTIATLALLITASHPAEAQRKRGGPDVLPAVTVAKVVVDRINERVAAVGSARARQQVTLTTRVAGVISEVLFKGGDIVEADQSLVKLISEAEQITVETAAAQLKQASDTVDRYKQLNDGTITRVARAEADTALKVAEAALRRAKDELSRMTIKAPYRGIMGISTLQEGDYLGIGSPIASIDDRSTLLIEFTVPEAVAQSMKVGLPVRATLVSRIGEVHAGTIEAVGTRIDPVTRTLVVRAEIPNPNYKLIPGSTFSISIQLPGDEAPRLPSLAIQWDRQGAYVWRVKADNTIERVGVAIVNRDGDSVHVDAPLNADEAVIHMGGSSLRPGQQVKPQSTS